MFSVLLLGFLIGMQHALEADHIAAVASIAARHSSPRSIIRHGMVWGIGHSVTLMLLAAAAIYLNWTLSEHFGAWSELVVGVMLIALGGHVIYRVLRDRIHFHRHDHGNGTVHFHAHSHAGEGGRHEKSAHDHVHRQGLPLRSFIVGIMHGVAGTAALLVLSATAFEDPWLGMIYVFLFGAGSVLGMAALSAIIAVPLSYSSRFLTWANRSLQILIGVSTVALGFYVLFQGGQALAQIS